MTDKEECCPAMTLALYYSHKQSQKLRPYRSPGLARAFIFSRMEGALQGNPIVYNIPAEGRGSERILAKNIVVNFCPFCGKEFQKLNIEVDSKTVIKLEPERKGPQIGEVSAEAIRESPGLQLGARYHLDAGPKPRYREGGWRKGRWSRS